MTQDILTYAVDDDPLIRDIYAFLLQDKCRLQVFESADACAPALAAALPDLLLLDIEMPGTNGYDFCQQIKADPATVGITVIFVSGHDSIEERLKAYDAGGEDFIGKPFVPEELLRKVKIAEQIVADKKNLREQLSMSEQLSSLALASMDESGLVLQFMSKLIGYGHGSEVAQGLLELMQRYGITGAVQTRVGDATYTQSPQGSDLPLEVSVMNHLRSMETIFEFRNRAGYNYPNVTLMVANMPLDDPDLCGRIRDNLATAAAAANARLEAIAGEQMIQSTLDGIQDTLGSIRQFHDGMKVQTSELIFELDEELAKAFVNLGLTTNQENLIEDLIKSYMNRLAATLDTGDEILGTLQELSNRLKTLKHRS